MMRIDLLCLFRYNTFGIDVDVRVHLASLGSVTVITYLRIPWHPSQDNYRIVMFHVVGLPSRIPPSPNSLCVRADGRFLRDHFTRFILVNHFGGDISQDYDTTDIIGVMEEAG
jgi:hypothetical protein